MAPARRVWPTAPGVCSASSAVSRLPAGRRTPRWWPHRRVADPIPPRRSPRASAHPDPSAPTRYAATRLASPGRRSGPLVGFEDRRVVLDTGHARRSGFRPRPDRRPFDITLLRPAPIAVRVGNSLQQSRPHCRLACRPTAATTTTFDISELTGSPRG
jgi:hypothetical protein